jgi:hypothetical protein
LLHVRLTLLICLLSPAFVGQNVKPDFTRDRPPDNFISFSVPGSNLTIPRAINDLATVTGYYASTAVPLGGFLRFGNGQFTTFEFPGAPETTLVAINVNGDVIGTWDRVDSPVSSPTLGFVRSHWGVFSSIDVPGSTSVWPVAINASGTVVGYYSTATDYEVPYYSFIRSPNGVVTTFNVPAALDTVFLGMNDAGVIIGYSYNGMSDSYFELRNGVLTTLNVAPGDINLQGDIVGTLGLQQGFVRSHSGALTYFNVPGAQWGTGYLNINNLDYVVGGYSTAPNSPVSHGFFERPTGPLPRLTHRKAAIRYRPASIISM